MAEDDIKKTTFRAGSSGIYEFTHMPFGLSNAGSSFCRLMEQCLGDQKFVTLLLYLDDICIFAPDVSAMLDQMELVFSQLKSFNVDLLIFSKTELKFLGRQAFASIKHGFFQVSGKCYPQAFPTPVGVTVLECPAISLDTVGFEWIGRC